MKPKSDAATSCWIVCSWYEMAYPERTHSEDDLLRHQRRDWQVWLEPMGDFDLLVPVVCLCCCTKVASRHARHYVYKMDTCRLSEIRFDNSRYLSELG